MLHRYKWVLFVSPLLFSNPAPAQLLRCAVSAAAPLLRVEGVSERLGEIVFSCSGGTPGAVVNTALSVFLPIPVTNQLSASGTLDVMTTVDTGAGPVSGGAVARLGGASQVVISGLHFTVPASGSVVIRISNLRGDLSALAIGQTIRAQVGSTSGTPLLLDNAIVTIGLPAEGLLASTVPTTIAAQIGSPLPETISFSSLLTAGARFSSSRVTEGFATAFEPRQPMTSNGTRILLRFRNVPADARLFAPDFIAGAGAAQPTAAGDFGGPASPGQFSGAGLLLARVRGHDPNGAGGQPPLLSEALQPGAFESVTEIPVAGGLGVVVYEVLQADPARTESAQIPVWVGIPRSIEARTLVFYRDVSFGPLSTTNLASVSAPVPRFAPLPPRSDCVVFSDCSGGPLPKARIVPPSVLFLAQTGPGVQIQYLDLLNDGGGTFVWSARIEYANGSGWLRLFPQSGVGPSALRLDFLTDGLPPGRYDATLVIDAGPQAGTLRLPVTATVTSGPPGPQPPPSQPPPQPPPPVIQQVVNLATGTVMPLVRSSLASIRGAGFGDAKPVVTFDGIPADVIRWTNTQIDLIVPQGLGRRSSATVIVEANNRRSAATVVSLAETAPGIFGIINTDGSLNAAQEPALVGSAVAVFLTGLLPPEGGAVELRIHDRLTTDLLYVGPAPGLPGVQQVNFTVPADLPAMTTDLAVCGIAAGQRSCSPPARITLRQ